MQYAIPAIIAMAASSLYNIIDGIFIGQGVGPEAIMGLALTQPFMSLTAAFGAMVGVGASTLMSVRLGQKDYDTAQHILGNVIVMNVVMGLGLGLILLVLLDPILLFFGASQQTLPYAHDFMSIILIGNVVTHLYLGLNALLRSTSRPKQAMYATIGTVLINIVLAPLFIYAFRWGIRGAALATVTAQLLVLLWQFRLFSRPGEMIRLRHGIYRLRRKIVTESLTIGLAPFLINLCACLVVVVINQNMVRYGGDIAVGAYGIANSLGDVESSILLFGRERQIRRQVFPIKIVRVGKRVELQTRKTGFYDATGLSGIIRFVMATTREPIIGIKQNIFPIGSPQQFITGYAQHLCLQIQQRHVHPANRTKAGSIRANPVQVPI